MGGEHDRSALLALKKGVLAKEAEIRLQGSSWVPTVIRTEHAKPQQIEDKKAGKKKVTSKAYRTRHMPFAEQTLQALACELKALSVRPPRVGK